MPNLLTENQDIFSCEELSVAIDKFPMQDGRITRGGLFKGSSLTTTSTVVEYSGGKLRVLSASEAGSEIGEFRKSDKRKGFDLTIPMFMALDIIKAADVQNVRAFGRANELETVQNRVNSKLRKLRADHDITLEYMMAGALQGIVRDGEGKVLVNLFNKFEIERPQVDFTLGTATSNLGNKVTAARRLVEQNSNGALVREVRAFVGPNMWDKLMDNESFKRAYDFYDAAGGSNPQRDDVRKGFKFKDVVFEEYSAVAYAKNGNSRRAFFPADEISFYPVIDDAYEYFRAPADFNETVNTEGLEVYAKIDETEFARGYKLLTESLRLPICTRPECLVRGFSSN